LDVHRTDLIGAAPAIVPMNPDGMIDTAALVESALTHNLRVTDLLRDTALQTIAVEAAAAVDTACSDAVTQILNGSQAGIWKWFCTNGLDHNKREIGLHAVCCLHIVTRFGPPTYRELHRLGGRVNGEKNCQKGITGLVKDEYLVQTRLGRQMLFGLHPRIAQLLPLAGTREHRDEVAFANALESGRRIIVARHNKNVLESK
jgi:hypothetical protein